MTFKYSKKIDSIDIGGFTIAQWKSQREILKSDLNYSNEWEKAVDWYDNRLKVRYFDPMARIEKSHIGEGFSLATIHCALIEHFASLTQGKIHNHKTNKSSPKYEYSSSSEHFQEFLKKSYLFSEYFTSKTNSQSEFDTKDFYVNVRCALLHEACTKNDWRINSLSCGYSNPQEKIFMKDGAGVKRLFRDVLTKKLRRFLENYKKELQTDEKLRLYFARKLDHLCEIKANKKDYEWWNEIV